MAPCASFAFLRYIVISAQGLKIRLHVSAQHVSTICKGTEALPNICFGLSRRSPRLISHREERKEGNRPRLKSWKRRWMERATRYRARLKEGRTSRRKVSAVMINKCAWGAAFERVLQRMYIYIYSISLSQPCWQNDGIFIRHSFAESDPDFSLTPSPHCRTHLPSSCNLLRGGLMQRGTDLNVWTANKYVVDVSIVLFSTWTVNICCLRGLDAELPRLTCL